MSDISQCCFKVQGSGFRVQGAGFRVQGSGFRVQRERERDSARDRQRDVYRHSCKCMSDTSQFCKRGHERPIYLGVVRREIG